ncbi:MAG: hypothetical protein C0425_05475 [Chlorobiaceae bacterium]|nr:hypothetical protein [Chlorobiaceae bacterium]MBA4309768.1 hypothetical protein [Chlorobiaceae bacterium]
MQKYVIEFIGSFFLLFVFSLTQANPFAIGFTLMILFYLGNQISGGHYNSAVSLAFFMRGKINAKDFLLYTVSQISGVLFACLVFNFFTNGSITPQPEMKFDFLVIVSGEALFTFFIVLTYLVMSISDRFKDNPINGLVVGMSLFVGVYVMGGVTGAVFNPSVALGTSIQNIIIGGNPFEFLPIYLVGPFLGAMLAAILFNYLKLEK